MPPDAHARQKTRASRIYLHGSRRKKKAVMLTTKMILEAVFEEDPPPAACQACQADLALFVDAELNGQPAARLFPVVAEHLATCTACQQGAVELTRLLAAVHEERAAPPPLPAAFDFSYLPRPAARRPWHFDELGRLVIQFSADLLRSLQAPRLQPAFLKGDAVEGFELTIAEEVDDLQVTVQAAPETQQPELVDLTASVDIPSRGGWPNLAGIEVIWRQGDTTLAVQMTDAFGQASLRGIPQAVLAEISIAIAPPA
jgi:hypothetical protein